MLRISTDLFTGFHNETEEDFQQTLSLMREVGFDSAFMFKYSERPGTFALKHLPDNVPEDVKIERLNRMIALQNEPVGREQPPRRGERDGSACGGTLKAQCRRAFRSHITEQGRGVPERRHISRTIRESAHPRRQQRDAERRAWYKPPAPKKV